MPDPYLFPEVGKILGPELAEFYRRREEGLMRLEDINNRLIKDTEEYRRKVDEEEEGRKTRLEAEYSARKGDLEAEYQKKAQDLNAQTETLEQQKKELDDRRATHARRAIYRELKEALKARNTEFCLTKATQRKRLPVHYVFGALIVAVVAFAIFAYMDRTSPDWYRMTRLSVGMLGLAAALVWYVKWNDQWFREHAQEEFRLKRLDLDVDRASWLVEMALEFKTEKGATMPTELIDRLSQNLFASTPGMTETRHPAEDLSEGLLSALSSLKVNVPGIGEAVFKRSGLRKLQKETEKEE